MTHLRRSGLALHGVVGWLLVGLTGLLLIAPAPAAPPRPLVVRVERVADGDTLTALSENGTTLRIRLLGIDAPEIANGTRPGQPYGEEARDYLDHRIGGKTVRVEVYGRDQFHRLLAVLWDDTVNVNLLLVAMGYAEVYRGAPCQVHCQDLATAAAPARRDRIGMWAPGKTDESPAAFRTRMRLSGT